MLNTVPAVSAGRQPRGMVKIMGSDGGLPKVVPGWISWECDNNAHYSADTFRVTFAAQGLPIDMGMAWMLAQSFLNVEILAGFPADPTNFNANELTSLIIGRADEVHYDPLQNTVEITGRDYTSAFIDAKTMETWKNKTVTDVVNALATRHGMKANVATIKTQIGTYADIDHVRLADQRTEWDLLIWLAHEAQCDLWVNGTTLYFQPQIDPTKQDYYLLQWVARDGINTFVPQGNMIDLKLSHNMTIGKGIQVLVKSWHGTFKNSFSASYPGQPKTVKVGKATPVSNTQNYVYSIPGLDVKGCLQKAEALYNEIAKQEMQLDATLPGDNILNNRVIVKLVGTGTAFDQVYYPSSVHRSMSMDEGYRMTVRARNLSPSILQAGEYSSPVVP